MNLYLSGAPPSAWDQTSSQYYFNTKIPDPAAAWDLVKAFNSYVFRNGEAFRSGGNYVFTGAIPPSLIPTSSGFFGPDPLAPGPFVGLGVIKGRIFGFPITMVMGPTVQNTLVVGGDCTTVQTSHPGPPSATNP